MSEPRTEAGRAYLAELNGEKEPPEEWRDAPGYIPRASRRAWEHDRDMILAIEREAAAPQALTDRQRLNDEYMRGYRAAAAMLDELLAIERRSPQCTTAAPTPPPQSRVTLEAYCEECGARHGLHAGWCRQASRKEPSDE